MTTEDFIALMLGQAEAREKAVMNAPHSLEIVPARTLANAEVVYWDTRLAAHREATKENQRQAMLERHSRSTVPYGRRERKPVIDMPREQMPSFTRAGNTVCETCGLEYRDHQAYRYTDDPGTDLGLTLYKLCDGREVKL